MACGVFGAVGEEAVRDALTVRDIREQLSVSDATVRQWIATGKLRAYQLPGSNKQPIYRVLKADLEWFLKTHRKRTGIASITDCA